MKKISIAVLSFVVPALASAQVSAPGTVNPGYITSIISTIKDLLDLALPVIIAAAVVYFIYGIAKYVLAGDEAAKEAAKDKIVYGIIGLVVMVSVWGIVNIVIKTLGITDTTAPTSVNNLIPKK